MGLHLVSTGRPKSLFQAALLNFNTLVLHFHPLNKPAMAEPASLSPAEKLPSIYPGVLERIEGGSLVWRDGTRMPLDDGKGKKGFKAWLDDPDIEDMIAQVYPAGEAAKPPLQDFDPGRARNAAFFGKMYGDCRKGEVTPHLVDLAWLPKTSRQQLKVTHINGIDAKLASVSAELDELPAKFWPFLKTPASTYSCRTISGTDRTSAHGAGIAIDIAVPMSDYWRWPKPSVSVDAGGGLEYRNRIPIEIVHIFERHGFIWGGRWYHYDTMHFEYRPELIAPQE